MKNLALGTALLASLSLLACGDGGKKRAKDPTTLNAAPAGGEADMPGGEPDPGTKPAKDTTAAPSAGAPGGMLAVADMTFEPAKKGKSDKSLEVKADGTVLVGGKKVAKISGDEVTSDAGTSMATVGVDGSLVGNGVKPGLKFEGDDLVDDKGVKLSVAEDGTVNVTKDGKTEALGAFKNVGKAKRAALLVTALWLMTAEAAPAKPAKPAKK